MVPKKSADIPQYIDATTDHITPCSRMRARGNQKKKVRQAAGITLCMTGFDPKMIAMAGQPQLLLAVVAVS